MMTHNLNVNLCKKNYRFKHTCNDDNDIGRRKLQKTRLSYLQSPVHTGDYSSRFRRLPPN